MSHAATSIADAVGRLLQSEKFRGWKRPSQLRPKRTMLMGEKHWTPQELAKTWGVSVQTIRELFKDEDGVLKIGRNGTRLRRRYMTLRIPNTVAERVHTRLSS
jgi:hypothetical protein